MKDLSTKENTIYKGDYSFLCTTKSRFSTAINIFESVLSKKQTIKEKQPQLQTLRQTYQS